MGAIAYRMPREMALLGLMDGVLSFASMSLVIMAARTRLSASAPLGAVIIRDIMLALCLTAMFSLVALAIGLYKPQPPRNQSRLVSVGLATLLGCGLVLFLTYAELAGPEAEGLTLAARLLTSWGVAIATARIMHAITVRRRCLARYVLLFGDLPHVTALQRSFHGTIGYRFEVPHRQHDWSWKTLRKLRVWGIVVASSPHHAIPEELLDGKMRGLRVWSAAAFQERYLGRIDLDALSVADWLNSSHGTLGRVSSAIKRCLDLTFGSLLLLTLWPVMLVAAIVIRLDSPGPALYLQQRIGQFGKPFTVLKFRSMRVDAEQCGMPLWAQHQDPRVTRVGRFIRATRIDELPQLFNVLRGNMSLVGPRPERPHFVEQLGRAIPFYQQRHYAKPGLTGWAQVNYPYGASVEDARQKLAYDLYYIKNGSLLLDLAILCDTVRVVLNGEGAR